MVGTVSFLSVHDVGDGTVAIKIALAAVLALTLEDVSFGAPVVVGDEFRAIGIGVIVVDAVDERLSDSWES